MHLLGKIAVWLCVVLAFVAMFLSTMLLDVRHHWQSELQRRRDSLNTSTQQLAEARRQVRALEEEHQRLTHGWGNVWAAPGSRLQPGSNGFLDIGVGSNAGFNVRGGERGSPAIFVFADTDNGQSQFLGEFVASETQGDRLGATPAHPPLFQEPATWPDGTYRVRENLPSNWIATLGDLYAQQALSVNNLQSQQLQLQRLNQQVQASQAALDQRMAELNGDPDPPAGAPQEVLDGLVETVRKLEAVRNQVLNVVNELRLRMDREYVALRKTLDSNREKVRALEQAIETRSPSTTPRTTQRPEALPALTTSASR